MAYSCDNTHILFYFIVIYCFMTLTVQKRQNLMQINVLEQASCLCLDQKHTKLRKKLNFGGILNLLSSPKHLIYYLDSSSDNGQLYTYYLCEIWLYAHSFLPRYFLYHFGPKLCFFRSYFG